MRKYTILLDSSNTSLTVGLADDNGLIDSISYEAWQCQSEHMIPELDNLLNKYSVSKDDICRVVTSNGPGSYTGVRIALTIAKILGTALDIDVHALSSLAVLKDDDKPSICLINARSNRSYFGVYQGKNVLMKDQILTNDKVSEYINEHKDYSLYGNVKYLGLDGVSTNIAKQMFSLIDVSNRVENHLSLTPVYMKD